MLAPTRGHLAAFVAVGVIITTMMERLATGPLERWAYAERMPIVPLVDIGLVPVLQWIVLPPLIVWFVRRQVA